MITHFLAVQFVIALRQHFVYARRVCECDESETPANKRKEDV